MARRHLAVFLRGVGEKVLSGEKQVDIRLSRSKSAPYLALSKEDEIYVKVTGGKIIGKVTVDNVLYYENLNPEIIKNIQKEYALSAKMDEKFWGEKLSARYATIIFLKKPIKFLAALTFTKHDRRSWVIMKEEGNSDNE